MRKQYGKPHLYMRGGVWKAIQWKYGSRATDDVLMHATGATYIAAWNALHWVRIGQS